MCDQTQIPPKYIANRTCMKAQYLRFYKIIIILNV